MSMKHERRVNKLEKISPPRSLPRIRLVRDKTETLADAFKASGHTRKIEDFSIIQRVIIDPLPSNDDGNFMASVHPAQAN